MDMRKFVGALSVLEREELELALRESAPAPQHNEGIRIVDVPPTAMIAAIKVIRRSGLNLGQSKAVVDRVRAGVPYTFNWRAAGFPSAEAVVRECAASKILAEVH